jgi:hypothetical protein
MDRKEKLDLARLVFSDVMEAIRKWEGDPTAEVVVSWEGAVLIDGDIFFKDELKEK